MATKTYIYHNIMKHLLEEPGTWQSMNAFAQLLNNQYVFQASHTTRADYASRVVGSPIALTSKGITVNSTQTFLDFDNLDFTSQGTPNARWCVIGVWDGSAAQNTDKLLACVDLNFGNTSEVIVSDVLQVNDVGFMRFNFAN